MNAFSAFDWPHTVNKIVVTPGYTVQSTGVWVPETTVTTKINAHVSDLSIEEKRLLDPGIVEFGARKIAVESSVSVNPGDRIEIYEDQAGTKITEWVIESQIYNIGLLDRHASVDRNTYLMSLRK